MKTLSSGAAGGLGAATSGLGSRKRTFGETGKLGSTVAAQQFVFMGGSSSAGAGGGGYMDEGSQSQFSRLEHSASGYGNANNNNNNSSSLARSASLKPSGGSSNNLSGAGGASSSLFAQLGARRGIKSAKSVPTH
jgi:hypothetical protein